MPDCCKDRSTPYCSVCGTWLEGRGLGGLLQHLKVRVTVCEKEVRQYAKIIDGYTPEQRDHENGKWCVRRLERTKVLLAKWSSWFTELSALLADTQQEKSDDQ